MYHPLLNTFLTVSDCGSFNRAAEKLYITPAAVMNQINHLEKHLDLQLFYRSTQGLKLTEAGQMVYRDSKKIMRESEKMIERARAVQNAAAETIRIGSSFLNPCHVFLDLWNRKAEKAGAYKFKIIPYDDDRNQILSVVERLGRDIDFLVGAFNSEQLHKTAQYLQLGTYSLCVAMPPAHDLAKKQSLEIEDLYGQRLVIPMQENSSGFLSFLERHPQIMVENTHYFYDMDTFNYCEQNHCLLLTLSAWANVHPSLVTLPVNWHMEVPYGLLYARNCDEKIAGLIKYIKQVLLAE